MIFKQTKTESKGFHVWTPTHNHAAITPACVLESNLTANVLKDYANFKDLQNTFPASYFMQAFAILVH